ncbi:hypothetical protein PQE20_27385 (plasmid) [Vibrio harveyi]|uniref:hypothetical protein n=1 Tax=Vibrio harveyi TaxID=669 RepID=UPI00234CAE81|nr:hypothetical protein [Vibrio harveyi]WCP84204.1 hypothetical protein PQE20_27385 [Vibrio harveyi]
MKVFEVTLSTKPMFKVHNYEKIDDVVCENKTGWCDSFNKYTSVEDFLDSLAKMAFLARREFRETNEKGKYTYFAFIEGLGEFIQDENGWWKLFDNDSIDEFGMIEYFFDDDFDLEVDWGATEKRN